MMDNLALYEQLRNVPDEAKRPIESGRLRGKTDINPMWRIKKLTEQFGPCGFGWVAPIVRTWIDEGGNGERTAHVEIALSCKLNDEWSKPITGIGGSMLVTKESKGLYTDDDCYKKAYTDAISVACKSLGMAADVYFEADTQDGSKYGSRPQEPPTPPAPRPPAPLRCCDCGQEIADGYRNSGERWPADHIARYTARKYGRPLCVSCGDKAKKSKPDGAAS